MSSKSDLGVLLFRALEQEITSFIKDELSELALWPSTMVQESLKRRDLNPDPTAENQSFHDYLYYQQKLEGIARNAELISTLPKGVALNQVMSQLLQLGKIRNDFSHARDVDESLLEVLLGVCRELVSLGFGGTKISDLLIQSQVGFSEPSSAFGIEPHVWNNLPAPEYHDTGFIGRNALIGDLVKALKSKSGLNNYLWLTGLGGYGKTAVAREVAERLLWDRELPFEVILWISFKTHELTTEGPKLIQGSFQSAIEGFQEFPLFIDDSEISLAEMFQQLGVFKTLVVMDNCETYPGDMQTFIEADPPSSTKFLFTSRRSGEFRRNIPISLMDFNECRSLLARLNRAYESPDIANLLRNQAQLEQTLKLIGMAPLNLKWLVRACNLGSRLETVLNERDALIRYCVENVYESLDTSAKHVLHCLQAVSKPLSVGDLNVLMGEMAADSLNQHVATLSQSGLIIRSSADLRTEYAVDETARDFLALMGLVSDDQIREVRRRAEQLVRKAKYQIQGRSPYSPFSIDGKDVEPLVCSELGNLLKPSRLSKEWTEAELRDSMSRALDLVNSTPRFWEAHRVLGFIYSKLGEIEKALESLQKAIQVCPPDRNASLSRLHYFFGQQLAGLDDERSSQEFAEAVRYQRTFTTLLSYGKSLTFLRDFALSETTLLDARSEVQHEQDLFYVEKALFDCYRRQCEGAHGEELLNAGLVALTFALGTTEFWDVSFKHRGALISSFVETVGYVSVGYRQSARISETEKERVTEAFLKVDRLLEGWGVKNWPIQLQNEKFPALGAMTSIVNADPHLSERLERKCSQAYRELGQGGLGEVSGPLKVWYADRGFGFMTIALEGNPIEVYFNRRSFNQIQEEANLSHGRGTVRGMLHEGSDNRFYLLNVSVE